MNKIISKMNMMAVFLIVGFSNNALAVSDVSVTIDGKNYTCSEDGTGGGNKCNCIVQGGSGLSYTYEIYKRGVKLNWGGYYNTSAEALSGCKDATVRMPECFSN